MKTTGAAGYSFDHWWIAQDKASSKYAQWYGCRRILEGLRRGAFDAVVDGRQQYQGFGPWTWLAGTYPHPTLTDEQPESFKAFPDLHTDRVSANRQRFAAWTYRVERFAPPEIMPGFITHQSERNDDKEVMRRDRFRPGTGTSSAGNIRSSLRSARPPSTTWSISFPPGTPRNSRPSPRTIKPGSGSGSTGPTRTRATSTPCDPSSAHLRPAASTARRPSSRPRHRLSLQSQSRRPGGALQARPHDRTGQGRKAHDQGALSGGGPAHRLVRGPLGLRP